jgi:asparagine synthase (glutamine-hydrolysing)
MANEEQTLWVVMNGELYNHWELRKTLEQKGHRFRTRADTEVLVHGWEEWGRELLERLNGIYAFGVLDLRGAIPVLWLGRDPVGVKPLYVGLSDDHWWFASELAAARKSGLLDTDLRREAFDEYLVYRFVPSPGTFYRNAWKVPPAHVCRLSLDDPPMAPTFARFQAKFAPPSCPGSRDEWKEALRSGLRAAVGRQLMSDVPVGSLLSGGVDSTVITRLMYDGLGGPLAAFGVGFGDETSLDELASARRAAAELGVSLTEVRTSAAEYLDEWPQHVAEFAEPIANSSSLMLALLCRAVKGNRKVVLTGQGADEPLGGYPRHVTARFYPLARAIQPLIHALPEKWLSSDRVARMRRIAATANEARRFVETLAVFSPSEAVMLTGHTPQLDALTEPVQKWLPASNGQDAVNRLLMVDARLSLADDLLIVADHTSMASGVELRVPFLDLEFLGLIEHMPSRYKISRFGERKWLYREAVEELLPAALRPDLTGWRGRLGRKLGFTTPLDTWFSSWRDNDANEYLLGKRARMPEFLSGDGIRRLLDETARGELPRGRQLMTLYVLESWLRGL